MTNKEQAKIIELLRQILFNQTDIMDALPSATWIYAKAYNHDLDKRISDTVSLLRKTNDK